MAHLTSSIDGNPSGTFQLDRDDMQIGRHPDCDIVVDAGAVSRFHAKIRRQGTEFAVEDAGSRNGTFVNGKLLARPHVLTEGDRIRISDVVLVFHGDETPGFASASGSGEMSFDGSSFGILMVDETSTKQITGPKVEFRSGDDGLKMTATAEAKLAALIAINSNLTGAISVDEVLPKVLSSLFQIFPSADRGFVVMETAEGALVPRWVQMRNKSDDTETVRISRTIIRQTMETGHTILSLDAMDDSRFDSSESIADFSIRSMMCAPLHDEDGKAIGALQIDSTQGRGQFRDEDIDLLTGIAAQASVVINNARMHEQALRQQEVEQDLKLATEVQHAFLPAHAPTVPTYHLESFYQAANHIGGDYFDYVDLPDGRVAVVVADVVGHGVAAAMYMAKLSAETRFCLASEPDLARAVERLNDRMSALEVQRFVTYLLVVIDPNSNELKIVNAGHMPPILRDHATQEICEPGEEDSGLPIAIDEGMEYAVTTVPMHAGDLAVMYTDGFSEALNLKEEEWGTDPIRNIVLKTQVKPNEQNSDASLAKLVKDEIVRQAFEHMGTAVQFDDMCLVIIERTENADGDVSGSICESLQSSSQGEREQSETINELDINDTLPADVT
ncbi:SpoIIE family protein phosphatase [Rhodopirellula sp. JC740]|uniref:SpoIIE family protein phosphatase n=1 Tax=Rhodopirellula halodulae TaxID=2894198 RepID=A0ABS8NCA5_9BACT|nr:SpoIIE family protein phosphatase [Rhodopirellula sp. JC740]MCC9641180.1 SpoIIE family protein phosphatase [Rhodopirellula sp. JC740]